MGFFLLLGMGFGRDGIYSIYFPIQYIPPPKMHKIKFLKSFKNFSYFTFPNNLIRVSVRVMKHFSVLHKPIKTAKDLT